MHDDRLAVEQFNKAVSSYFIYCSYKLTGECSALRVWCTFINHAITGRDCASRVRGQLGSCTSLVPRQMIVVFSLGTRLHVCMRTTLENGVLCNEHQPQRCEWLLSKFEAMKMTSGWETVRCGEHPFCAKIKVSA